MNQLRACYRHERQDAMDTGEVLGVIILLILAVSLCVNVWLGVTVISQRHRGVVIE